MSATPSSGSSSVGDKGAILLERIKTKLGSAILEASLHLGEVVLTVDRTRLLDVVNILKLDTELQFNFLSSVTAVDWMDARPMRFEGVYHFISTSHGFVLRLKVPIPENDPTVDSLVTLYSGANFMERECWDMLGISFKGHPDQRRILMYDEFKGHPLRKDYPLQGKQPRMPLRSPEVQNTARDMKRPVLYSINKRPHQSASSALAGGQSAANENRH